VQHAKEHSRVGRPRVQWPKMAHVHSNVTTHQSWVEIFIVLNQHVDNDPLNIDATFRFLDDKSTKKMKIIIATMCLVSKDLML
jgi:hypothetical protein